MEDDYHFGTRRFIIMRNNVLDFNTRDALKDQRGDWLDPEAKKEFYSWTPEEKITKKKRLRRFIENDSGVIQDKDTLEILRNNAGTWINEEAKKQYES